MPVAALKLASPQQTRPSDPLAGCTDAQRREAGRRLDLVLKFRSLVCDYAAAGRGRMAALEAFVLAHPEAAQRTLYRWCRRYEQGGIAALVDGRSAGCGDGCGTGVSPVNPESCSPEAWQRFLALWLTTQQRTVTLCYEIVAAESPERGWSWPALRTIQAKAHALPGIQRDYYRLGERQWKRKYAPKLVRNYADIRAGAHWVSDFHPVDVFCRRSESDPEIIRPLWCSWYDLRSTRIMGWNITERENQDAILLTLGHAIRSTQIVPLEVTVDNGKPYRAKGVSGGRPGRRIEDEDYVRSVFGGLGIIGHFSIPYNPDSKPVEPWHRVLEQQLGACFATYCGHDENSETFKAAWREANAHPDKCPTLDQLRELIPAYLAGYHATARQSAATEGLSPNDAFERFDPLPRAALPDGALDILLMRTTRPVKVTSQGVRYDSIQYGEGEDALLRLIGQEVLLRVDPIDAGHVVVCDLRGAPICKAYNNRLLYTGVTRDDIAAGMRRKKRARTIAREIRGGLARAELETVADAAIQARLARSQKERPAAAAATGTHDAAPVARVLRSDLMQALTAQRHQQTPPPPRRGNLLGELARRERAERIEPSDTPRPQGLLEELYESEQPGS